MKTVLASVSDKTGLVELLKVLQSFEPLRIIATGSTAQHLTESGLTCETVESLTGFPEILEGRVKTLHPKVFGGILAKPTVAHQGELQAHDIPAFDFVIVNLYPFAEVARSGASEAEMIENIDIGGVALIRAAAKNYNSVVVLSGRETYPIFIQELANTKGQITPACRKDLARRAFEKTAYYDSLIASVLETDTVEALPQTLNLRFNKVQDLRYGENPQQQAAWYQQLDISAQPPFEQLQGKPMSANNLVDAYGAFNLLREFPRDPAACIIKHNNPCGVAIASNVQDAFEKAYACDPMSAFGGIIGLNRGVTKTLAEKIIENFVEIVIAADFSQEAIEVFATKPNIRILRSEAINQPKPEGGSWAIKDLESFGILLQETGFSVEPPELTTVTQNTVPDNIFSDVAFAWAVVKHLTSNAIVVVKDGQTVGLGIGQTSRIGSLKLALEQAGDLANGAVLASDGFFPAEDNIEAAAQASISVIVQPGGSLKDPKVIEAADQHGLAMVMTGERCFKH